MDKVVWVIVSDLIVVVMCDILANCCLVLRIINSVLSSLCLSMLVTIQEKISLMQPSIFEICTDCIPVVPDCIPMVPGASGLKREVKLMVICIKIEEAVVGGDRSSKWGWYRGWKG